MKKMKTICIGKDFTTTPIGRYREDGNLSGEVFREDYLIPALNDTTFSKVVVDLAGAEGYGSSFLEEVFGGLIRKGFSKETLSQRLEITSSDSAYARFVDYAKGYMNEAVIRCV